MLKSNQINWTKAWPDQFTNYFFRKGYEAMLEYDALEELKHFLIDGGKLGPKAEKVYKILHDDPEEISGSISDTIVSVVIQIATLGMESKYLYL